MKSLKVAKMNLMGMIKPTLIYYTIMIAIMGTTIIANYISPDTMSMSGVEAATIIFLFILGLNSFKANFYFAKSNNISRKTFIKGLVISVLPITTILSIIDIMLNRITNIFVSNPTFYDMSYQGSFRQLSPNLEQSWVQSNAFGDIFRTLAFHLSFCVLAYILGIVINMIYYRCNKLMKVVVTVVPIALFTFGSNLLYLNIEIAEKINNFTNYIFGFDPVNVYAAVITFLVAALVLSAVSFLLIRKAVIKER